MMKLQRRFMYVANFRKLLNRAILAPEFWSVVVRADDRKNEGLSTFIEGYAAVFYRDGEPGTEYWLWDDVVERIMPGAFDRAMKEDDVRALFNHDADNLLGRNRAGTLELSADKRGLSYAIDPPDTQVARDLVANIRAENVTGSSFSFVPRKGGTVIREEVDGDEKVTYVIERNDVELWDVGPVTFPAYEGTTAGTRTDGLDDAVRAEIEAWRESRKRETAKVDATLAGYGRTLRLVELSV